MEVIINVKDEKELLETIKILEEAKHCHRERVKKGNDFMKLEKLQDELEKNTLSFKYDLLKKMIGDGEVKEMLKRMIMALNTLVEKVDIEEN